MILKVLYYLLFSALFYLAYRGLYARLSFHRVNRWLLLIIPPISLLIAFIAPEFNLPFESRSLEVQFPEVVIEGQRLNFSPESTNLPSVGSSIYTAGIILSVLYFLSGLFLLSKILKTAAPEDFEGRRLYFSKHIKSAFCFAKWVFIPESQRDNPKLGLIIKHELIHQKLGHSINRIYYKALTTLLWFDPFIHFFSKEIRQVHEYEVDEFILEEENIEDYAHMLLSSTLGADLAYPEKALSPSPFFNSSLIKSRITMMYKKKSANWRKSLYLGALPLLAGMILFACNKSEESQVAETLDQKSEAIYDMEAIEMYPKAANCEETENKKESQACAFQHISQHIADNFTYPKLAQELGMEGRIFVSFVIEKDGSISETEIVRSDFTDASEDQGLADLKSEASEQMKTATEQAEMQAIQLVGSIPAFERGALYEGKTARMRAVIPIQLKLK